MNAKKSAVDVTQEEHLINPNCHEIRTGRCKKMNAKFVRVLETNRQLHKLPCKLLEQRYKR